MAVQNTAITSAIVFEQEHGFAQLFVDLKIPVVRHNLSSIGGHKTQNVTRELKEGKHQMVVVDLPVEGRNIRAGHSFNRAITQLGVWARVCTALEVAFGKNRTCLSSRRLEYCRKHTTVSVPLASKSIRQSRHPRALVLYPCQTDTYHQTIASVRNHKHNMSWISTTSHRHSLLSSSERGC